MSRAIFDAPMTCARVIPDRRNRQRDLEPAAVLGQADRLEVVDPLAEPEPRDDVGLLVSPLGRDDQRD